MLGDKVLLFLDGVFRQGGNSTSGLLSLTDPTTFGKVEVELAHDWHNQSVSPQMPLRPRCTTP
jgi:hypothetical protein